MSAPRLLFVTGKGGVGKTTVAAALAKRAARDGQRVLIVEMAADRGLAALFGKRHLRAEPAPLAPGLYAVRIEAAALVEKYFARLLRLPFLARRLLASNTFRAVTAAAPGVSEFLTLESLLPWLDPGLLALRRAYGLVIVDGPATGHALQLLRTPRQLARMVPGSPIGSAARRLLRLLSDPRRTAILLVTVPDEMATKETIEAHAAVADDLAPRLTRPVMNRTPPHRFSRADIKEVARLSTHHTDDPLLAAARLQIRAQRDAEHHLGRLRRAFGMHPVSLPEICDIGLGDRALEEMGAILARALLRP